MAGPATLLLLCLALLAATSQPDLAAAETPSNSQPAAVSAGSAHTAAAPEAAQPPPEPSPTGEAPAAESERLGGSLTSMLRMVLVLGGVLLLAYLLLHKGLGALSNKLARGRLVRVVDRVGLEPKKALYVVEVAGQYFLIGTSDHGVSCLATLSGEETQRAFADALRAQPDAPAEDSPGAEAKETRHG